MNTETCSYNISVSMSAIIGDVSLLAFLSSLPRYHCHMTAIVSQIVGILVNANEVLSVRSLTGLALVGVTIH